MLKPAAVTEREAAYLEHRRRAAAQDLPLSEYCGAMDCGWRVVQVQRGLARKGVVNRTGGEKAPQQVSPGAGDRQPMVSAAAMPMGVDPASVGGDRVREPAARVGDEVVRGLVDAGADELHSGVPVPSTG